MLLFDEIRANITMKEVAEGYDIKVNKKGMACCPFHDDKTPSMKIRDNSFYCFGCQERGDAVDFVSKLFEIEPKDAAFKIIKDFNLPIETKKPINRKEAAKAKRDREAKAKAKAEAKKKYEKDKAETFGMFVYYAKHLKQWKEEYRPSDESEPLHPLFVEALQNESKINTYIERFEQGDEEEMKRIINDKETLSKIRERAIQIYHSEIKAADTALII